MQQVRVGLGQALEQRARKLVDRYVRDPETVAIAITGSLARGTTWQGSDVDVWVFRDGPSGFVDGVDDGIYWEVDLRPAHMLDLPDDPDEAWLEPYPLHYRGRMFEALWGCRIAYDPTGRLARLKEAIDSRMADPAWREERAHRFIAQGRVYLEQASLRDPVQAIVDARSIATDNGLAAWWLLRGGLMTGMLCLPEQLDAADGGSISTLYAAIFGLGGRAIADEVIAGWRRLPREVQLVFQRELELKVLIAYRMGCYDGFVRYLRQGIASLVDPNAALPVLGIEADTEAQKTRVINQAFELLDEVERSGGGQAA